MAERVCEHPGCGRLLLCKGLCTFHYNRKGRGIPLDAPYGVPRGRTPCRVDGCKRNVSNHGLCPFHHSRREKGLPLDTPANYYRGCPPIGTACWGKFGNVSCGGRSKHESGLCSTHRHRMKTGFPINATKHGVRECTATIEGRLCDGAGAGLSGLCKFHQNRKRNGTPLDKKKKQVGGWRFLNPDGYIDIGKGTWRMKEHRHIMEQHLGRPLLKHENVHHINGNRADNRLPNLELWNTSQPSGQRIEDKLAWAREIIALYGDLPLFDPEAQKEAA